MIISPLTRTDFETYRQRLLNQGIVINKDSGSVTGDGVTLSYFYNGIDSLTIVIVKKPFYYPEDSIENEIRKWFSP